MFRSSLETLNVSQVVSNPCYTSTWAIRVTMDGLVVHIITRKRLNNFALTHPDVKSALNHWYRLMKAGTFQSLAELRAVFPTADQVGKKLVVFNIGGNKVRLITAIHYNRQIVYIRAILTHAEYDQEKWKE